MSKDKGTSIFDELDSRLDNFFSEHDDETSDLNLNTSLSNNFLSEDKNTSENDNIPKKSSKNYRSPLDNLKVIVLEMDWEINDENLNKYLNEIEKLKNQYSGDRAIYLFFKLHNAVGKYMLCKKAGAHPDALKYLYQVYNSLEKVINKNYSPFEKNKLILNEVNNFKNLKAKMFPAFYSSVELESLPDNKINKPDFSNLPEDIQKEINKYIEKEIASKIQALKNELIKP